MAAKGVKNISRAVVACLIMAFTLDLAIAVPATAATNKAPDISWLVAGDSYSSGQGLPYRSGLCAQAAPSDGKPGAWGVQAANYLSEHHAINLVKETFVACTGAKLSEFFNPQGPEDQSEWNKGMGKYDMVTFTFGGDNVGFSSYLEDCLLYGTAVLDSKLLPFSKDFNPNLCPSYSNELARIESVFLPQYRSFLGAVSNNVVVHGGNIVVLGYPYLFSRPSEQSGIARITGWINGISETEALQTRTLVQQLNMAIRAGIKSVNEKNQSTNKVKITYISVNNATPSLGVAQNNPNLFRGHELGSNQQWLNGIQVSTNDVVASYTSQASSKFSWLGSSIFPQTEPSIGLALSMSAGLNAINSSFHPNESGNNAMAALVVKVFPHLSWNELSPANPNSSLNPIPANSVQVPSSWVVGSLPPGVIPGPMSCANATICTGFGSQGANGVMLFSQDGAKTWSIVPTPQGVSLDGIDFSPYAQVLPSESVSCGGGLNCVEIIHSASGLWFLYSSDGGQIWTVVPQSALPAQSSIPSGAGVTDTYISCSSGTDCTAIVQGNSGLTFLYTKNAGSAWQLGTLGSGLTPSLFTPPSPNSALFAGSLSCSQSVCAAVWSTASGTVALSSSDGGSLWIRGAIPRGLGLSTVMLSAAGAPPTVSCASDGNCMTIFGGGPDAASFRQWLLISHDGGVQWQVQPQSSNFSLLLVSYLDCYSASDCVVVAGTETDTSFLSATTSNFGQSWSNMALPPHLIDGGYGYWQSLSCTSSGRCIAGGVAYSVNNFSLNSSNMPDLIFITGNTGTGNK